MYSPKRLQAETTEKHTEFVWGDLRKKKNNLKDLCVDGRKTLKLIFKKWDGGMDWIDMTQDRDR